MSQHIEIAHYQSYSVEQVKHLRHLLAKTDYQRLLDPARVNEIFLELHETIKAGNQPLLPQCLCVAEIPSEKTEYLVDGQHRLAAYLRILDESSANLNVCVNRIQVTNMEEVSRLFHLVNHSVGVTTLPEGIPFSAINPVLERYLSLHPSIFSKCPSGVPRKPHIHQAAFERFIASLHAEPKCYSNAFIIEKIDAFHDQCGRKRWDFFKTDSRDTQAKVEERMKKAHPMYLGMWVPDEWIRLVFGENEASTHAMTRCRKRIPHALRNAVWNKYMGRNERHGLCPFCSERISITDFHCAHDVADHVGGDTNIDNLYPCCALCNLSAGTKSFEAWLSNF